ncbi:MAG TPA: ABC transporter permease [Jiangellaceae bacterium]
MTNVAVDEQEFTPSVHVYEPHKAGLPRLRPYLRELWHRRQFINELSRTNMRAAHTNTVFGQIWLVINPLLLACVYFLLVQVIANRGDSEFFVHLVGGLFAYYYFSGAVTTGASSVVGGGKLLMNISFPKLMLPLSALRTAFFRFLPTLAVYFVIRLAFGQGFHWEMLLSVYFLLMLTLFAAGMGMFVAAIQVYFRDMTAFLPYFLRIWLYLSPVLWYPEDVTKYSDHPWIEFLMKLNPLYSMLGGWGDTIVAGEVPALSLWLGAAAWALPVLAIGALFYMSREREFVVRL